ncbi:MAG: hypothetical protein Q7S40_18630 [Opitutaceae bacterium]|nr:hypothetical protein [Opitutaceae bacterium]
MSAIDRASPVRQGLERAQWRQLALITVAAVAIFLTLRALPTGTNLSHMDFRVDPRAGKAIEFCDPSNPQFIPVVAVRSPVVMTVATATPAMAGAPVRGTVGLHTASGKPLAPEDLLYSHTRKMHLLVVDKSLEDYQHVHPEPGRRPGDWNFSFTPHRSGAYRIFADFTPAATSRGLYASVDLNVAAANAERATVPPSAPRESSAENVVAAGGASRVVERDGYRFSLTPAQPVIRAGEPAELALAISRADGSSVPLEPVMDALAHLVAFDQARSGFAHLHPAQSDLDRVSGPSHPVLHFKLMIPSGGRYVIWAQLNLGGRETFVPFWFDVAG